MHGQFVWYELTTPDVAASIRFYPGFTGWGTQAFDADYTMWTTNGAPLAGIFKLSDEMKANGVPPNWMLYIESDDVDATMAKVATLGGTVVVPAADIPGTGRFGVAQDPQGAMFGVYKSVRPSNSWDGTPVIGGISWHELMTTDYQKANEFYGALFGWKEIRSMDMGGGMQYSMFGHGKAMYGGTFNRMPDMASVPPFWLVYIHVDNVAKAVQAAVKAGGTVVRPEMEIPGGTIAILADPQGAGFALHQLNAEARAALDAEKKPKGGAVKKAKGGAKKVVRKAAKAVKKAKAAVGKALEKAAKAVKGAVKKVKPAKKAKAAAKKTKTKPAARKAVAKKARGGAKRVVAKTPSKAKAAAKQAGRFRAAAKKKR